MVIIKNSITSLMCQYFLEMIHPSYNLEDTQELEDSVFKFVIFLTLKVIGSILRTFVNRHTYM